MMFNFHIQDIFHIEDSFHILENSISNLQELDITGFFWLILHAFLAVLKKEQVYVPPNFLMKEFYCKFVYTMDYILLLGK